MCLAETSTDRVHRHEINFTFTILLGPPSILTFFLEQKGEHSMVLDNAQRCCIPKKSQKVPWDIIYSKFVAKNDFSISNMTVSTWPSSTSKRNIWIMTCRLLVYIERAEQCVPLPAVPDKNRCSFKWGMCLPIGQNDGGGGWRHRSLKYLLHARWQSKSFVENWWQVKKKKKNGDSFIP